MATKRTEKIGPPAIKVEPMPGLIIIDPIKVLSNYEKEKAKKNVTLTRDQIIAYNKEIIESTKDALAIWTEHPDQAYIVALPDELAESHNLRVGDHIAYNHSEYTGMIIVYKKKRYLALRPGEILFRYLTDEV